MKLCWSAGSIDGVEVIPINRVMAPLGGEEVVDQCIGGDRQAWARLYSDNVRLARLFLFRLGVEPAHLDDVTQEVFLEVFRYLPGFRGECTFKTWFYRVCVTQARRAGRTRRVSMMLKNTLAEGAVGSATTGPFNDQLADRLVQQGLSQLGEKERLVFVLYEFEGMAGKQIAGIADCPEATVWRRLHYARKRFVSYVEEHGVTS